MLVTPTKQHSVFPKFIGQEQQLFLANIFATTSLIIDKLLTIKKMLFIKLVWAEFPSPEFFVPKTLWPEWMVLVLGPLYTIDWKKNYDQILPIGDIMGPTALHSGWNQFM